MDLEVEKSSLADVKRRFSPRHDQLIPVDRLNGQIVTVCQRTCVDDNIPGVKGFWRA